MNRKNFLSRLSLGASAVFLSSYRPPLKDKEPLPPELVEEFVRAGHNDLEKVKLMLKERPTLNYASWDWGNGDFETALEGASHLGRKEIANYLIQKGARPSLFTLAMLGRKDLVVPLLEAYPSLLNAKGAHGFTLLHHARVGNARELADWLRKQGLTEGNLGL